MRRAAPRKGPVPPRKQVEREDTAIDHAELCVRVMERFLGAVDADPKLGKMHIDIDLWGLYADVLQEELGPHAFDLAYHLFSESDIVKNWRRDKDQRRRAVPRPVMSR